MPLAPLDLAVLLAVCAAAGAALSWFVRARIDARERAEVERAITRSLQARYETYEGLEQCVLKLLGRFGELEREFHARLAEAREPRAALAKTVHLRSRNPELWDLEREHCEASSRQLAEISRQGTRIVELMRQAESLERDLEQRARRHETAVANAEERERAALARSERFERRAATLERALGGARAKLAALERQIAADAGTLTETERAVLDLRPLLESLACELEDRAPAR